MGLFSKLILGIKGKAAAAVDIVQDKASDALEVVQDKTQKAAAAVADKLAKDDEPAEASPAAPKPTPQPKKSPPKKR